MTGTEARLTRAAMALLAVATGKQTDRDYVAAVAAELRVVSRLLEEREWLRTFPGNLERLRSGGTPEDAA